MMEHLVPPPVGGKVVPFDRTALDRGITEILEVDRIFAKLPKRRKLVRELGLLPGAPTILAGRGGTKKTMLAQSLLLSVAIGGRVWGLYPVEEGRAVHLDWEQGEWLTRQRYQRLAQGMGIGPVDIERNLAYAPNPRFTLDAKNARDEMARLCEGASIVLIDSLRVAAGPAWDENSSNARVPLDLLRLMSEQYGWSVLVLHHARKGNGQRGAADDDDDMMRGSSGIRDATESVLQATAKKGEPTLIRQTKSRSAVEGENDLHVHVDDDPEHTIEDEGGELYPCLRVRASLASEDKAKERRDEKADARQKVLDFVLRNPSCSGSFVVENVSLRRQLVYATLEQLKRDGLLEDKPGKGKASLWQATAQVDRRTGERPEEGSN